ncbi:MAG: arginine deiminase family protein [Gemmatimonadaceae bacterium]|nr:arginine deiminase family protein [Gemmatimonadaceae bacterium]
MKSPWIAFTRDVSPAITRCELTHLARTPIDVATARAQHRAYEALLALLGCEVRRVAPAPEHPDAVFIEDTAVVLDEVAVITRPGAAMRRDEVVAVVDALAPLRPLARIESPATLDGGDVLAIGRSVYVGMTGRTNGEGIAQLRAALAPFGYAVRGVPVTGCLHLKTAVTAVDDATVLLNPAWVSAAAFEAYRVLAVDAAEPMAANVLRIGEALVYGASFPRTLERLHSAGFRPHTVDASELAKAEGAVTCCSLVLRA